MNDILGLGNALVDILVQLNNDQFINDLGYPKGSMQLIDYRKAAEIERLLEKFNTAMASGGSAANTIHGLAMLGAKCGYIGKICKDVLGDFYLHDLEKVGVNAHLLYSKTETGRANTFITPDSERTFATYLGAAIELTSDELEKSILTNYKIIHIEGYLVQNYDLIETALKYAKELGLLVSLDLASFNVVDSNLDFLKKIVPGYVDILFANEDEAKSYTGKEPEEALEQITRDVSVAIVKIGDKGSLIKKGDKQIKIGTIDCKPIDTTGAGDQYAAGFLYGLCKELDLQKCGELGALLAGRVIEKYGARIKDNDWSEIRIRAKEIIEKT